MINSKKRSVKDKSLIHICKEADTRKIVNKETI